MVLINNYSTVVIALVSWQNQINVKEKNAFARQNVSKITNWRR